MSRWKRRESRSGTVQCAPRSRGACGPRRAVGVPRQALGGREPHLVHHVPRVANEVVNEVRRRAERKTRLEGDVARVRHHQRERGAAGMGADGVDEDEIGDARGMKGSHDQRHRAGVGVADERRPLEIRALRGGARRDRRTARSSRARAAASPARSPGISTTKTRNPGRSRSTMGAYDRAPISMAARTTTGGPLPISTT